MRHEAPKPLVYLALSIVVLIALLSGLIKMCAKPVKAETLTQDLYFADYTGGINHIGRGYLAPNEYLSLSNFLLFSNYLQVRKGYIQLGASVSTNPLKFMDMFATKSGSSYLLLSDGDSLWYRSAITGPANKLNLARSNDGLVDTWGTYVSGDTVLVQKWRTLFGSGEGLTMTINGADYIISKVTTDTSLVLTTSAGTQTDVAYNIDYASVDIEFGIPMATAYWLYANTGRFAFFGADSFVSMDAITGTRYRYTNAVRACGPNGPNLQFLSASVGATADHSGKFLRIVTNPLSEGTPANPVTGTHPIYLSYPIRSSLVDYIYTEAAAFAPATPDSEYFTIEELEYDSTYDTLVTVDSVRLLVADSAGFSCSGREAKYLAVYYTPFDSNTFITADWFFAPRYAWSNGLQSFTGTELFTTASTVFPVVGGFEDATSGAIYVAVPPVASERNTWTINGNAKSCLFYRMKKASANTDSSSYTWAARYDNRVFWSEANDPTLVKKSDPHDPESQDGIGFYMFTEEGDAPLAGLVQGDVLKVYCENSIHIITSADGYLYTTEQVARNVGCSSPKTLKEFGGTHYFLHRTGVYEDNGSQPVPISQKVNFWFTDSIPQSRYREAAAAIYDKKYWISFPLTSGGRKTLVYDLLARVWTDMSNLNFSAATTFGRGADSLQFLFGDADSAAVLSYFGNLDRSDSIVAVIQTDYVDAGTPDKNKIWRMAQVAWDNAAGSTMTMDFLLDPAQSSYHTYSFLGTTFGTERINPPSLLGRVCSFKLTVDGAAGYKHRLIKVGIIDKGFAP